MEFAFRKWDGTPHWVHQEVVLGDDECGTWIGQPQGWTSARPGAEFRTETPNVSVVADGAGWVATFFGDRHPNGLRIYVDLVADLRVDTMTGIDMDLDVVQDRRGVRIVDEDEFAEHRISMGYPDDLVTQVEKDALDLLRMIAASQAPFDGRADEWLARLDATRV